MTQQQVYFIPSWKDDHETSDGRTKGLKVLSWVQLPTRTDGRDHRLLMGLPNGRRIYGVFALLLKLSGTLPVRGLLADEHGPMNIEDLAMVLMTPREEVQEALDVLTTDRFRWVLSKEWRLEEFKTCLDESRRLWEEVQKKKSKHPLDTSRQVQKRLDREEESEGQERTGQERKRAQAAASPAAPTPSAPVSPVSQGIFKPFSSPTPSLLNPDDDHTRRQRALVLWGTKIRPLFSKHSRQYESDVTDAGGMFGALWPEDTRAVDECEKNVMRTITEFFPKSARQAPPVRPMQYLNGILASEFFGGQKPWEKAKEPTAQPANTS